LIELIFCLKKIILKN
jgi:selenocysteine lyase/cysteine desulfurase